MALWSAEIKQIENLLESFKGQIPELEKELGFLFRSDDPNVLMLYSRRCLEVLITDLCERELKRPRKTDPLKGIIDKLNKEEKVPSHIITSMHGLNDLSTYGAHPKDFDPEQVKPALSNLAIVLKWYLKYKGIQIPGLAESEEDKLPAKQIEISSKVQSKPKKKLVMLLTGLALLITAVVVLELLNVIDIGIRSPGIASLEKSIAVLPFRNDSPDTANIYFIDGLMEEVLNNLQRIKDLRVISRTSVEQFRNQTKSIPEIARELGVNFIIEGSGQKFGNTFRLRVQLVRADKEDHLWGESYQNEMLEVKDIFKIQNNIAESIASELKAVITPQEDRLINKIPTSSIEAWEAYLSGRFYWRKLTKKDLETAMQYFELANERDPGFALAYVGIARVWTARQQIGVLKTSEASPWAATALMRALEMDSTCSEVHQALGSLKTWTWWDLKGGEASFKKAIELNPNNADAHSSYSLLLHALGKPEEALRHIEIAQKLDPLNSQIKSFYGINMMSLRRFDDAVKSFREAMDLNPLQGTAENITPALFLAGREKEAFEMQKNRWKNNPEYLKAIEEGYAAGGFREGCKRLADFRVSRLNTTYSPAWALAIQYSMAGDTSSAMFWLGKSYEEHNPNMIGFYNNPLFDELRPNTRFQALARKMNLPYK